jgi:hypothetical protein
MALSFFGDSSDGSGSGMAAMIVQLLASKKGKQNPEQNQKKPANKAGSCKLSGSKQGQLNLSWIPSPPPGW